MTAILWDVSVPLVPPNGPHRRDSAIAVRPAKVR